MAKKKLIVTQVRSANRHLKRQRETLHCLGLGRIGRTVEQEANPAILGMVKAVSHLVRVKHT